MSQWPLGKGELVATSCDIDLICDRVLIPWLMHSRFLGLLGMTLQFTVVHQLVHSVLDFQTLGLNSTQT